MGTHMDSSPDFVICHMALLFTFFVPQLIYLYSGNNIHPFGMAERV
jgi:hypothetical protein